MTDDRPPSDIAKKMITLAQLGQIIAKVNGPACAYCGQRYDFANRPVSIENCCPDCLPPGYGEDEDSPKALRGWAAGVREEHFLTAAEVMERAAFEIESLRRRLKIAEHHVYFCDNMHECPTCGVPTDG